MSGRPPTGRTCGGPTLGFVIELVIAELAAELDAEDAGAEAADEL